MAWIESHQSLATHKKLYALMATLKISRAQAIGHLHLLWWWALDNAPDGDLSGVSDEVLADVSNFLEGRSHRFGKRFDVICSSFGNALRSAGFIDSDGKLHDWNDYAGKLIQARVKDRIRHTKSNGTPTELQRNSEATVPNRTQPYPTVPIVSKDTVTCTRYGEFNNVLLKEGEYNKLLEKLTKEKTDDLIEKLSLYMQQSPANAKKYKDHYATILNWSRREVTNGTHQGNNQQPKVYTPSPDYGD